ncbi:Uma2 family endonuclease [Alienimonas chondri]|uniref:Uma2 family endonuclease n=1 Tax=Alienimonas chondri TaxID=2681879 RepID=UPI001488F48F|nr:Uma2 family endonuclease [Alienimonas chondri]
MSHGPVRVAGPRGVVTIPASAATVEGFRRWTRSDEFPEQARIDLIADRIFVDLSMQRHQAHALPKTEIVRVLANLLVESGLGELASDVTRVFLPDSGTSFEPDVVLVSFESIESGRVTETAAKDGADGVEFVGSPSLVVEVVSPSSVGKDTVDLPAGCFEGGVGEYWLVDCRDDEVESVGFVVHARGEAGFEAVEPDADGFAASPVLGKAYRLSRDRGRLGRWAYRLEER